MTVPALTPPSDRERLIGALLAVRNVLESLKDGKVSIDAVLTPDARSSLMRDLLSAGDGACRFPAIAYRLPPTLVAIPALLAEHAFGAEEPGSGWRWLRDALGAAAADRGEDADAAILQLLDLDHALAADAPMPAAVAEARGLSDRVALTAAGVATAPDASGPQGAEARRRWERADVVVIRKRASWELGAVVGIDIDLSRPRGVSGGRADGEFVEALHDGARAAAALLADIGVHAAWAREELAWRIAGISEHVVLEGNSVALPAALAVIRRASQLGGRDLGPINGVASGGLELKGSVWVVEPLPRTAVANKVDVVQRDLGPKVALIARTAAVHPGVRRVEHLADAALAAWGHGWTDWATQRLVPPPGWSIERGLHGLREAQPDGMSDCASPDLEGAATYFRSGTVAAVLGDLPRSGRTTLARQLVARLIELEAIADAVWISPPPALSGGERIFDVLPVALAEALRPYGSARVLVVVENLIPDQFGTDGRSVPLDSEMAGLADALGQPVLAIAQYMHVSRKRWRTDGIKTFVAWGDSVNAFADAFIGANETLRALTREQVRMATSVTPRDLGLFRSALGAVAGGAVDRAAISAELLAPLHALPTATRRKLRLVGAFSRLGMALATDAAELGGVEESELASAGAQRTDGGWQIPSPWLAARVASAVPGEPVAPEEAVGLLRGPLDQRFHPQAVAGDSAEATLLGIVRGAARLQDGTLTHTVEMLQSPDRLPRWALRLSAPTLTALLDVLGDELDAAVRRSVLAALVEATIRPASPLGVAQLAAALTTLRNRRGTCDPDVWARLEQGLESAVKSSFAFDSTASAAARIHLLSTVLRFHLPETRRLLYAELEHIFGGLEGRGPQSYVDARRAIAMLFQHRWAWRLIDDPKLGMALAEITEVQGDIRLVGDAELAMIPNVSAIKRLLLRPARKSPIGTWLGWLGLCDALNHNPDDGATWVRPDWDLLVASVADEVAAAVDRSTIPELTHAIRFLSRYDRAICVRLCNRTELAPRFATRLSRARSFGERADLVELTRWLHATTARDLLMPDGHPDLALARSLAAEAKEGDSWIDGSGDLRGIGRFITACAAVDELFGSATAGFGRAFVDALGAEYIDHVVVHEPRPSLVYHLMEGLVTVSPPLAAGAAQHGAARLYGSISASGSAWAARLALSIGGLPEIGGPFLAQLATELDVPRSDPSLVSGSLLRRLFEAPDPEAATWFHRLAAAIDGEDAPLAKAFAGAVDRQQTRLLNEDAPEDVATMCKLAVATLHRAGDPDGRRTVSAWLRSKGWVWVDAFTKLPDAERALAGLGAVRSLDPRSAHDIADELTANDRFVGSVLRLAERSPLSGAQLLHVLDRCRDQAGTDLLASLSTRGFRWQMVVEDVLYEQDPATQAQAVRLLAGVGWRPDGAARRRLGDRWRDLAVALRSPRALEELLRAAASLPDAFEVLEPLLDGLQDRALGRRVREGSRADLERVPGFLAALRLAGAQETAQTILEVARADGADLRGPPLTVQEHIRLTPMSMLPPLLHEIQWLEPEALPAARDAARCRLEAEAQRPVVADPTTHWHAIGRGAALLGMPVHGPPSRPRSLQRGAPGDLLLACAWLRDAPWAGPLIEDELARIRAHPAAGWVAAVALAVRPGPDDADDRLLATAIDAAPAWALRVLLDHARFDGELLDGLDAQRGSLAARRLALEAQGSGLQAEPDAAARAIGELLDRTPEPRL